MTALTVLVRRLGGLPLVAAALLIAAPAQAGPTEDTLKLQGDRWNAAYSAGDWTALRALYADDAWLMTDKAPALRGADAIIAYLRRFRDSGAVVRFRFENEDVVAGRPFGIVIARYWMTAQRCAAGAHLGPVDADLQMADQRTGRSLETVARHRQYVAGCADRVKRPVVSGEPDPRFTMRWRLTLGLSRKGKKA